MDPGVGSLEGGGIARAFPMAGREANISRFSLSDENDAAGEGEPKFAARPSACRVEVLSSS